MRWRAGQVDAYLEEGVQAWDTAAGGLIAAEAGAVVTTATPSGADSGVLAAGPSLHAALDEAVRAWSKDWAGRRTAVDPARPRLIRRGRR